MYLFFSFRNFFYYIFLDVLNLSLISINLTKLFRFEYNLPNAVIKNSIYGSASSPFDVIIIATIKITKYNKSISPVNTPFADDLFLSFNFVAFKYSFEFYVILSFLKLQMT